MSQEWNYEPSAQLRPTVAQTGPGEEQTTGETSTPAAPAPGLLANPMLGRLERQSLAQNVGQTYGNRQLGRWVNSLGVSAGGGTSVLQRQPAPPTVDPVTQAAQTEWDAHPGIHGHFDNGFTTYLDLRPLYQADGIANPAKFIADNITTVSFFGHSTPANKVMSAPLAAAEASLTAQKITPSISSFWAFVPRRTSAGALSNHAKGRAVDIDPGSNPHIKDPKIIEIINAVTGVDLGSSQSAADLRQASTDFKANFKTWADQQDADLKQLQDEAKTAHGELTQLETDLKKAVKDKADAATQKALKDQITAKKTAVKEADDKVKAKKKVVDNVKAHRTTLNGYAATGFLNLEQTLIDALTTAGFSWGGGWTHEKDFMHFEIP